MVLFSDDTGLKILAVDPAVYKYLMEKDVEGKNAIIPEGINISKIYVVVISISTSIK